MIRIILIAFTFFSFTLVNDGYTLLKDSVSCVRKIKDKSSLTNTLSANFSERKFSSLYNNPKQAKGKLLFKKNDKIRWEHFDPNQQIILINGKHIKYQENHKEIKNTTSTIIVKKIQKLMLNLINGNFLAQKEFTVNYYENNLNYKLILKPISKKTARYLSEVDLIFDKNSLELKEMELSENETEKVVYTFSNIQVNKTIDDSNFSNF
jgi:outer membrane lipoprotein-sorting protein